jgi:type I restriction enzyme S subunit
VRNEALSPYPVAVPDDAVWQAFASLIEPLFQRIKANGTESRTLAQTRDLLLPKLMSGDLRVRDAEALVAEVV